MKSIRDNTRRLPATQPVLVEMTITISEADAFWLIEHSEAHGNTPQRMASRIVSDVIHDDMLAHDESVTLQ